MHTTSRPNCRPSTSCSTPFGDIDECTLEQQTDQLSKCVCSTPFGDIDECRKVRLIGRGQVGAGRVYQVVSGHAACATVPRPHVRWLGEPPPRRSDRVSPGGESGPPGIPGPSAASPDRRPASATRCARPQTRPASPQAGRGHRHPGHDPSLVPETDRQEIRRQRLPPSRAADDAQRSRRARGQDGGRESAVGTTHGSATRSRTSGTRSPGPR